MRASVKNTTGGEQSGLLEITHDDKTLLKKRVVIAPGKEEVFTAETDASQEGIREVTARLIPDGQYQASSETVYVAGQEREKVLLYSGSEADERFLKEALQSQAYQLTAQAADGARSLALPADLTAYSAIIFNNIALSQLRAGTAQTIKEYVERGGGFLMIGGPRSFGLGGYVDTPVAEVLPVEPLPPQTQKKRLNLAVQLVLDKSKSMGDENKIDFAKEAAKEVVRNLKAEDFAGIIGFDSSPFIVVRLGPLEEVRATAFNRIDRLIAYGRTNLLPALDEARRGLDRVNAGRKHVIVLTDGKIPGDGPYFVEMAKQMRMHGITTSTVMLGGETDTRLLRTMAEEGGGSFYQTLDARNLPRIFIKDVKVAGGEETLQEKSDYMVRKGPGRLASTAIESFPPLRGYVETRPKSRANLELIAFALDKAEPLLASWEFGKGKTIAFTSDANGRWSNAWVPWPRFHQFWSELLTALRPERQTADESLRFDLRYWVEKGSLELDLSVFNDVAAVSATADLVMPDASTRKVAFHSISRGRYRATVSSVTAGKYELRGKIGAVPLTPVAFHLSGELFGEKKGQGFQTVLLRRIAEATGGKVNPEASDLSAEVTRAEEDRDVAHWFVGAGLLLLLLEIVRREILRGVRLFRRGRV